VQGEAHTAYATTLSELGGLYYAMGENEEALALMKQTVAIRKAALGDAHPDYAQALSNLGVVLHALGDSRQAITLLKQALAIRKASVGETHPGYAVNLSNLATIYKETGDPASALPLYQRALELQPDHAINKLNLAVFHQDLGQKEQARKLLEQARKTFQGRYGEQHPLVARCLTYLAADAWRDEKPDRAEKLLAEALNIHQRHLDDTFSALSERQRLALLERRRHNLDLYLSLAARPEKDIDSLYAEVLAWKGMVTARQSEEKLLRDEPGLAKLVHDLRSTRAALGRLAAEQVAVAQREAWRQSVRRLQQHKEDIEERLALKSAAFRAGRSATPEAVAKAIPDGAVLIDLLEYTHSTPPVGKERAWHRQRRLLAFIIRKDAAPSLVPLGAAEPIDRAVAVWRRSLGGDVAGRQAADELRRLVWVPIEKHLGKKDVLVAADGSLALMPFAALPGNKKDTYLIEERAIAHVPSGRHLLALSVPEKEAPEKLLALGGLDFGKGGRWNALPGSRAEAREVRALFRTAHPSATVHLLEGPTGNRAGLLRELAGDGPRWRYVHLATHAYYDAPRSSRVEHAVRAGVLPPQDDEPLFVRNPLLSCGVVLAGANGNPAEGALTAEEVGSLDLRGCELVVLSACETALGKQISGEGVLGLQRSFHLAGARSVVSSLWSVHDEATQVLMRRFYEQLWGKEKLSKLEALRRAQLGMLKQGLRDPQLVRGVFNPKTGAGRRAAPAVKDSGGRLAPAYWAAFVLSGDWR
jgi:CHAT domain-containing protein/Tfp pilus assembly protein PilF